MQKEWFKSSVIPHLDNVSYYFGVVELRNKQYLPLKGNPFDPVELFFSASQFFFLCS